MPTPYRGKTLFIALCLVMGLFSGFVIIYDHYRVTILPVPTGPFSIGRVIDTWVDEKQPDAFTDIPSVTRVAVAWIWYPTSSTSLSVWRSAPYLPDSWREALMAHRGWALGSLFTRDLALVRTHSMEGAPLAERTAPYPVVIMRPGLAALSVDYTVLAENLASHGYVVVGLDVPYRTAVVVLPDGRVVTRPPAYDPETLTGNAQRSMIARLLRAWTDDIGWTIARLAQPSGSSTTAMFRGRLGLDSVGIIGHSLGGAVAAEFCRVDPRCHAGVNMDGALGEKVVQEGIKKPFMFIVSDRDKDLSRVDQDIFTDLQSVYERLPSHQRQWVKIDGANHFSFSDQMIVRNQGILSFLRAVGILQLNPRRGLALATEYVRQFFDTHIKGLLPSGEDSTEVRWNKPGD